MDKTITFEEALEHIKKSIAKGNLGKSEALSIIRRIKIPVKPKTPKDYLTMGLIFYGKKVLEDIVNKGVLPPELVNYLCGDGTKLGILDTISSDFNKLFRVNIVNGQTVDNHLDRINAIIREYIFTDNEELEGRDINQELADAEKDEE